MGLSSFSDIRAYTENHPIDRPKLFFHCTSFIEENQLP